MTESIRTLAPGLEKMQPCRTCTDRGESREFRTTRLIESAGLR